LFFGGQLAPRGCTEIPHDFTKPGNSKFNAFGSLASAYEKQEFLNQLSKLGTHGTSVPDVAKTLIEDGMRQAIKDGFQKQRPAAEPMSTASATHALGREVNA
jgi:hypothetical protein